MDLLEQIPNDNQSVAEAKNSSDPVTIIPHPGNKEVAIVYDDASFLSAAQNPAYRGILHHGYKQDEISELTSVLTPEQKFGLIASFIELDADNYHRFLANRYTPRLAERFSTLGDLFQRATEADGINFKLTHVASVKPHIHFAPNMTYPLGKEGGTCFYGGQADPGVPFFIKPGFEHWTPKDNKPERQIVVFAQEFHFH